jgi:hypothetical protein
MSEERSRHLLVIANETVAGRHLLEMIEEHAHRERLRVTVLCPINTPSAGYVVYEDTRRAAANRRLEKTLKTLRDEGIPAHGLVVDADPVSAAKDAMAQLEVDELIVSTHPRQKSGWLRRDVVEKIRDVAGDRPLEHVEVDLDKEHEGVANVLVVANETVVGEPLLDKIRERAQRSPANFLIICPQSDPTMSAHPDAERRLRRALMILRSEGIEAHGQVAHPDPFTAAKHAIYDERVDELIVSTFGVKTSNWLRGALIERLRKETGLPVEHVTVEPEAVET